MIRRTGVKPPVSVLPGAMLLLAILVTCPCCGYRIRSSAGVLPLEAQSLGIPTFRNLTPQYRIEQLITSAVLKEFSVRTRTPVNSSSSGVDMVLLGEIREVRSDPIAFGSQTSGSQTFGSAFLVTVRLNARLTRLKDSSVVWQNSDFLFRERYVLNNTVRDFFSEENPALERLARDFAASLANSIVDRSTP